MKKEHLEILAKIIGGVESGGYTAGRTMRHTQEKRQTLRMRRPALLDGRRTMETRAGDSAR